MKVLIPILIGLLVVGCGKKESPKPRVKPSAKQEPKPQVDEKKPSNSEGENSMPDDASSKSKYKEELTKIKSLGEPTTWADLNTWYKAVPAANNSALAYLETRKSIPPSGPVDSAYIRAQSVWKRSKNYNPSTLRIHPSLLPSVRAKLIARNAQINQLLNFYSTSPANQPARFTVDWNNGWSTLLPHLAWLKRDANLLIMRSRIFADAGNAGEAIRSILAVHRLAHLLEGEPIMISVLVQSALYHIADEQIERLLNQFALNDAQLLALHRSIASFNVPAQYANAFIGERCSVIATDETVRNGSSAEIQKIGGGGEVLEKVLVQHLKNRPVAGRDLDMTFYLEFQNSMIKLFKSDYPQLPASHEKYNENVKTLARISETKELISGKPNPKYILSSMMLPAWFTLTEKKSRIWRWSLQQQLAGTAIAIERYRLANRTLPQSLNQLIPQYLSSLPVDPYSEGKTLRYAAGANGSFMLSSIESDNQKPKHPHPAPDIYTFGVNPALRGR